MRLLAFIAFVSFTANPAVVNAQESDPQAVVERLNQAYADWDLRTFMAQFADDAVARTADGSQVHEGRNAIRQIYRTNFRQKWPVVRVVEMQVDGDSVVVREAYPRDGSEICCSMSEYTVQAGKITELVLTPPVASGAPQ